MGLLRISFLNYQINNLLVTKMTIEKVRDIIKKYIDFIANENSYDDLLELKEKDIETTKIISMFYYKTW